MNRTLSSLSLLLLAGSALSCSSEEIVDTSQPDPRRIHGILLLDDYEDDNTQSTADIGPSPIPFEGFWYTYDDRKDCREAFCCEQDASLLTAECPGSDVAACPGTVSPWPENMDFPMTPTDTVAFAVAPGLEDEIAESKFAAHMSGDAYATWGAGMGINFIDPGLPFDATNPGNGAEQIIGIRFLGATANGAQAINVKIQDASGRPDLGLCIAKAACGETQGCYADWGKIVNLTSTWTQYEILFTDMTVPDFGRWTNGVPTAVDPTQLFQLQFQTDGHNEGAAFDVWIDNVGFILADGTGVRPPPAL